MPKQIVNTFGPLNQPKDKLRTNVRRHKVWKCLSESDSHSQGIRICLVNLNIASGSAQSIGRPAKLKCEFPNLLPIDQRASRCVSLDYLHNTREVFFIMALQQFLRQTNAAFVAPLHAYIVEA